MDDRFSEVKKELSNYRYYDAEIEDRQKRIKELRDELYSQHVFAPSERVSCSPKPNDRIEYLIDRIDVLSDEKLTFVAAKEKIAEKLDKLSFTTKEVLKLHYTDRKTLKKIAIETGYTYEGVRKIHSRGLKKYLNT